MIDDDTRPVDSLDLDTIAASWWFRVIPSAMLPHENRVSTYACQYGIKFDDFSQTGDQSFHIQEDGSIFYTMRWPLLNIWLLHEGIIQSLGDDINGSNDEVFKKVDDNMVSKFNDA